MAFPGRTANSVSNRRRLAGYKNSLKSAGIPFDPKLVVSNFPNIDGGRAGTVSLLTQRPEVDAIFAFNDLVAEAEAQGERVTQLEIAIPPGPRLGDVVVNADGLVKGFGDKLKPDQIDALIEYMKTLK